MKFLLRQTGRTPRKSKKKKKNWEQDWELSPSRRSCICLAEETTMGGDMIMVLTFLKGCQKKIKTCFISSKSAGQGVMGFSFRKAGSYWMFGGTTLKNKSNSRLEQYYLSGSGFIFADCFIPEAE